MSSVPDHSRNTDEPPRKRLCQKTALAHSDRLAMWSIAAGLGLTVTVYMRLQWMGAPTSFFEVLRFIAHQTPSHTKPLQLVEFFCGVAAHTRAFQNAGCPRT